MLAVHSPVKKFSFRSVERLKSKKIIEQLFQSSSSFSVPPLQVYYKIEEVNAFVQSRASILISVPRKNFPRAVDRNHLKRRMREAYRLNKHLLSDALNELNRNCVLGFVYMGKEKFSYKEIESSVQEALEKIKSKLQ